MKKDSELLFGHLVSLYSKEYAEKIIMGIKNSAKYPWITKELMIIYQAFQNRREDLVDETYLRISEIIEDKLAYTSLICQDSKCKPFNFIDFKK